MKTILRTEELGMLLFSLYVFSFLNYAWWVYPVFFLIPDISMIGYAINTRTGAFSYNLFHHKGIALLVYSFGIYFSIPFIQCAGIILFGHSSFDRILGYGLKYNDNFKHTHLGMIGKSDR